MDYSLEIPKGAAPIGYGWLEQEFGLETLPHHVRSFRGTKAERQKLEKDGIVTVIHPSRTKIGDDWVGQLEFAIKHEGIHLHLLRNLFPQVEPALLVGALKERPTGMYLRKIWYLYEALTGQEIMVRDLNQGNYVDLLDAKYYYTSDRYLVRRQRINQNLLGDISFCGIVRKTEKLKQFEAAKLDQKSQEVIDRYPPQMFERAMNYLYRKETKSSFEIENETADQQRTNRFISLLKDAGAGNFFTKESLMELQKLIVDSRFSNDGYRDTIDEQIYVGQSVGLGKEIVHFAGPKPEDTPTLMKAWSDLSKILSQTEDLHPVIAAAVVAFGFVFIHPFSDGNGRIHRFLIHHVLAKRGFAPRNLVFPVSAVMLKRSADYDAALESFSTPLMDRVEYELDQMGKMTVLNDTIDLYRSTDYTKITEILFEFVEETIETELPEEFSFLENYDRARGEMRAVVDMPDRLADLMIRLVLQNGSTLSSKKRRLPDFEMLREDEVIDLEKVISEAFSIAS